jgi:hypothetical protein
MVVGLKPGDIFLKGWAFLTVISIEDGLITAKDEIGATWTWSYEERFENQFCGVFIDGKLNLVIGSELW